MKIYTTTHQGLAELLLKDLFGVSLVVPLISSHVTTLGGSHFIVGLMGSFYSGIQLFSGPLVGSFSDVKGRKNVLVTTLLCCGMAYLIFGLTSSIYVLLTLRLVIGLFKHTQNLSKALVADIVDSNEHSNTFGKMAAISGVGIAIGPTVGGHIYEDYPESGFNIVCTIAATLFILNTAIVYFIISPSKKNKTELKPGKVPTQPAYSHYLQIMADGWKKSIDELKDINWTDYWDVFLLKFLAGFSMGIFYSNYSPLLKIYYGLSPKWIGYTISFQGCIGAFCSFFIKQINDKFYQQDKEYTQRNLHCFVLIFSTFLSFIVCSSWYVFAVLLIPLAIGNAILRLVGLEIIVHKAPPNYKGSLIGASSSIRSIAGFLAPMIAGYLGDMIGVQYVLSVSVISAFIGVVLTYTSSKTANKTTIKKKIK